MNKKKQTEITKQERTNSLLSRSLMTGFIGGIIWSIVGTFMYYFNFAEVAPKTILLRSWTNTKWSNGWLGDVVSILIIGVISILIAFIYYGLLKRIISMWMGVIYGLILWGLIFYILQPVFPTLTPLFDFNKETIVTTLGLFILYGTFIGYSISFDYRDTRIKERKKNQSQN